VLLAAVERQQRLPLLVVLPLLRQPPLGLRGLGRRGRGVVQCDVPVEVDEMLG